MLIEPTVNYTLKTTGAHNSVQNGLAKKPNQDLARMMRAMLYGAGLGSEYWPYALRHAVYLKNRLPHTSLSFMTPFEAINSVQPHLGNLRIFGSKAHFMKGKRRQKLDKMDGQGLFMTYKGTDKICYVIDEATKKERTVTHITFDKAFSSVHPSKQPPMAGALQQSGFRQEDTVEPCLIKIKLLSPNAKKPIKGSDEAAGWDIHTHESITIPSGGQSKISTHIALEIPSGYYGQLHVHSSLAAKYGARVEAGIIDLDYCGEIFIIMSNNGKNDLTIDEGKRIAQLIILQDPTVTMKVTEVLESTERNAGAFGSTGTKEIIKPNKLTSTPIPIQNMHQRLQPTVAAAASMEAIDNEPICNIDLSHDPFFDIQHVPMTIRGNHITQGLILNDSNTWNDRVIITTCQPGTPAAKIKNWQS
jgi:dUTP pyrophosphatase